MIRIHYQIVFLIHLFWMQNHKVICFQKTGDLDFIIPKKRYQKLFLPILFPLMTFMVFIMIQKNYLVVDSYHSRQLSISEGNSFGKEVLYRMRLPHLSRHRKQLFVVTPEDAVLIV